MLVGRDADLTELDRAFGEAGSGRPSIVVLTGEAGIGKSRLVAELAARVRAEGAWAVIGGCLDLGDGIPYLPFVEALRGLARTVDRDELDRFLGPARSDFARVVPELIPPDPEAATNAAAEPPLPPGRLYEGVIGLVDRVATVAPALLAIEDVHWIDRASRDLITFLVRNLASERVLLILTARTDALPAGHPTLEWLAELGRHPRAFRIHLAPLPPASVERQIEAILGERPDPELLARVVARADGNPFFAEELVAASSSADAPPPTLAGILATRLAGLSAEGHAIVGALAVAGRPIDETLLGAVLGQPSDALDAPIQELRGAHVAETDPLTGTIRLRHVLLAEVALRDLLPARRRALHEAFATGLEPRIDAVDAGSLGMAVELAWHWEAAGRWEDAFAAAIRAADAAEAVGASDTAHAQLERALTVGGRRSPPLAAAARVAILRRAADAADLADRLPRALELATEAVELADPTADRELAARLRGRLGEVRSALGDVEGADADLRAALDDPSLGGATRAYLLAARASVLAGPVRNREALAVAREAVAAAEAAGADAGEALARSVVGVSLIAPAELEEGLAELERACAKADTGDRPEVAIVVRERLAHALARSGRLEAALAEAVTGHELARRNGLERRLGTGLAAIRADLLLRLGRWAESSAVADVALDLDPVGRGGAYLAAVRGRLHAGRGESADAEQRLDQAIALGADRDPDVAGIVALGRTQLCLAAGDFAGARQTAEAALGANPDGHPGFVRLPLVVEALRAAGAEADRHRAGRDLAPVATLRIASQPLLDELAGIGSRAARAGIEGLIALAEAETSRLGAAGPPGSWLAVADALDAEADPVRAAYARFRAAESELEAHGVRADVSGLLAQAHAMTRELGAAPLQAAIEDLARRARITLTADPMSASPAGPSKSDSGHRSTGDGAQKPLGDVADDGRTTLRRSGLSNREIEVLQLVAAGRTNGQIAERLFITRKTAGVHVTHILDKLGVANRVEAAIVAARVGLDAADDA